MKVLHTADVHLRAEGDLRWNALETVLEEGRAAEVSLAVVSGDLFDRAVDVYELKPPLRQLFERYPFRVVMIPGNHDGHALDAGDYLGSNVTVLNRPDDYVDVGDVRVLALPYEDVEGDRVIERLRSAARQTRDDACNILLYHGELLDVRFGRGDFGSEDGSSYMPVRLDYFGGLGIDYVLAGHFHTNFTVKRYDGGYFVYPGSPVSITAKETGMRNVNLFETGKEPRAHAVDTAHFERVRVTLRPFDEGDPVAMIREKLASVPSNARVLLTVDGLVDLAAMGRSEAAFAEEIRTVMTPQVESSHTTEWRDVSAVVRHDLFERAMAKLEADVADAERRERIRRLLIESVREAIDAN